MKLGLFACLSAIETLIDPDLNKCPSLHGKTTLICHHMLSIVMYFNPLLKILSPHAHLTGLLVIGISWHIFKRKCVVTMVTNDSCGFMRDTKLKNFVYMFNNHLVLCGLIIGMIIAWDIYLISFASRS
jgi:hypothetical protein